MCISNLVLFCFVAFSYYFLDRNVYFRLFTYVFVRAKSFSKGLHTT